MTPENSNNVVTQGTVPDPKHGSIGPNDEVLIARELRSLLTTIVPESDDNAVALGARL